MFGSKQDMNVQSRSGGPRASIARRAAPLTLVLAGALVATALATASAVTIGSADNSRLGERVVVNAQGRTLYALSPETATHLLCKSSECMKFWPPLTVGSAATRLKDGPGVHGRLAILRRSNGLFQVTLRGMPLYRFSHDHAAGQAGGEGIESFGGTWHAVVASGAKATKPSNPAPQSEPMTSTPGY